MTTGAGANVHDGETRANVFAESTWREGPHATYGRLEIHQPEVGLLVTGLLPPPPGAPHHGTLAALTLGGVRDLATFRGWNLALGADASIYAVPSALRAAAPTEAEGCIKEAMNVERQSPGRTPRT